MKNVLLSYLNVLLLRKEVKYNNNETDIDLKTILLSLWNYSRIVLSSIGSLKKQAKKAIVISNNIKKMVFLCLIIRLQIIIYMYG